MVKFNRNEDTTDLLETSDIVLFQFGTETCMPCGAIKQRIDEWNKEYPQVQSRYVPLDEFPELGAEYGIFSAPTILVFVQGKVTIRESGCFSLDEILQRTERYIQLLE